MSVIGEAALSVFFEVLFQKIASSDFLKFVREKEVLSEINKWEKMLKKIRDVLDDAEEKQMTKQSVKDWLSDLQDLAYDVEDILDEFATESLIRKVERELPEASTSKVRKLLPSCCTSFTPSAFTFNSKMDSKIKEITSRLQAISAQRNELDLKDIGGGSSSKAWQRPPSTSLPDELKVYGRDEDKRKILDLITRVDATDARLGVLPIVGMGGLGKTTLTQLLYNDELLQQHFQIKAWVSVSDDFDILRITKGILESITSKPCDLKELNQVQLELQKELAGSKFLIVLDDVWTEHYEDWIALRPPFMDGAAGCRIIVTTRSMIVAQNMGTIEHHILESIADDDCWMLFRNHSLESRVVGRVRNLDIIRQKVISRCAGLPLAARTLGGLLRSKPGDKWEEILDSKLWSSIDGNNGVLPVLRLSYYHLPSYLKRCFSYCAIFPKDYEFTEMEVVLLWMAEGLILTGDNKAIEDVGSECFHDLLSRSLFQASSSGKSKFVMHDLVNDLARMIAGETCFRLEDEALVWKQFRGERARHFSYICGVYDGIKKFQPFQEMPCLRLRTFFPASLRETTHCPTQYLTGHVLSNLLPMLRPLRVLSFKGYEIYELPESIGDLKHLRYLDFSFTCVRSLPESTVLLVNLQTLNLRGCKNLKKLPSRIEKLINLRHLDMEGTYLEDGLPPGVKELVNLRTLSNFSVGKVSGACLTSLKNLKFLGGNLCISKLENVRDTSHGREANLKEKKDLHVLFLGWSWNCIDQISDRGLLNELQPPVELEELTVKYYGGIDFPVWVGDPSFHNLVFLSLDGCTECTSLPKLGLLQSLRNLNIEGMWRVTSIGREFYGEGCSNPFPSLQTLQFKKMDGWVDWDPCGFKFPCLHELTVFYCPKLLGKLPDSLSELKKLNISSCSEFIVRLPSLPMVSELIINVCKEVDVRNMVEFGSPNTMELAGISKFTFKTEWLIMEQLSKAKSLRLSLIFDSQLLNFSYKMTEEEKRMMLEELKLGNSESFYLFFFQHTVLKHNNFMHLQHLTVHSCPNLVSFDGLSFPSRLRTIKIIDCRALESLPNAVGIEELEIQGSDSLISIGRSHLSSTLKRLVISYCQVLQNLHLDEEQSSSSSPINLEFLSVRSCPSLISLSSPSRGELPPSLQHLHIEDCSKLESIGESFNTTLPSSLQYIEIRYSHNLRYLPKDLHKLSRLHEIYIFRCKGLLSFPEGGLPTACLKIFQVCDCHKLEALPDNIHNISSLQNLRINSHILSFPKDGLPPNLTFLGVHDLMKCCKPLLEWGLHRLTSLTTLVISGGYLDMLSFPCEDIGMVLPSSLITLTIGHFPKLEYLSTKGFQNLTSLESLLLRNCPNLTSLPTLPLSLVQLYIFGCPLLKQRCQKDKGEEWLKIAHIPLVRLDSGSAYDSSK